MSVGLRRVAGATAIALLTALGGCGSSSQPADAAGSSTRLQMSAAFYPLEFAAERIGGALVHVTNLTRPGAEPHDLELTPRDVITLRRSDLVVYTRGFQPAVDDAVDALTGDAAFDVSDVADLTVHPDDGAATGHDHEHEGHEHGSDEPGPDPHFWLDPVRYAAVVTALGSRMAAVDPRNAAVYRTKAAALVTQLETLDTRYRTGLADCANRDLVTGHAAFGYLAARYGLTQVSVTGISPDREPTASSIAALVRYVREHDVRTVYAETLVSPALTETLARETGTAVLVLDPIEGITRKSAGSDYLEVMASNLEVLRKGQRCR